MKKTMGKKIEIIKENPVAKALMGPKFRMKVNDTPALSIFYSYFDIGGLA